MESNRIRPRPKTAADEAREKHVHELQLMLIERFEDVRPSFNSLDWDGKFDRELFKAMSDNLKITSDEVIFNKITEFLT